MPPRSDHPPDRCWSLSPHPVGILPVPGWECVFGKNDCAMRDITFWVWVLRCGDQIGLVDTGLPDGADLDALNRANQSLDVRCVFREHKSIEQVLEDEGIRPEEVTFVLLSQLVTYCTGGITARAFPEAVFYCAWEGMSELLTKSPGHPPKAFYFTAPTWNSLRELLIENRLVFAQHPLEIAPGLLYEPTGGHHPGSAGLQIQTSRGIVGILETAFVQENITTETPIGIAENAALCRETIRRYKQICDLVIAGHDPHANLTMKNFLESA